MARYWERPNGCVLSSGVEATPARFSEETAAAKQMNTAAMVRFGLEPQSLGADKGYGSADFVDWVFAQGVAPHIPLIDCEKQLRMNSPMMISSIWPLRMFTSVRRANFIVYVGLSRRSQQHIYHSTQVQCGPWSPKEQMHQRTLEKIGVSRYEAERNRARALVDTWNSRRKAFTIHQSLYRWQVMRQSGLL